MRRAWLLFFLCCGAPLELGDHRCASNADCLTGQRCVHVTKVFVGTGDCLESSGADVCRARCPEGTAPTDCGCQ